MDLRLILLTDSRIAGTRDVQEVVEAALRAGAPAVQLRDKDAPPRNLLEQATRLREITARYGALLFVNDRLDVALAARADGVHLGPDDLPVAAARAAIQTAGPTPGTHPTSRFLIGFSTDDPQDAMRAQADGADYIGCGAVFGTTSKPEVGEERIGTHRLSRVAATVSIPVVAIGGVDERNAADAIRAGAAGVAILGAIMGAADPEATTRRVLAAVGHPQEKRPGPRGVDRGGS